MVGGVKVLTILSISTGLLLTDSNFVTENFDVEFLLLYSSEGLVSTDKYIGGGCISSFFMTIPIFFPNWSDLSTGVSTR